MNADPDRGFPPFTLVTVSSEAALVGCDDPGEPYVGPGVFSQHVPVGASEIQRLSVLLEGKASKFSEIPARIFRCDSPRDFGGTGLMSDRPLAETRLLLKGEGAQWLDWDVNLSPLSGIKVGGYIRIELDLPGNVGWVRHRNPESAFPGAYGTHKEEVAFSREAGTFCFRVSPAQPCFWAANVLPEAPGGNRFTGVWRSDPAAGFPQWIEVSWRDPLQVEELELLFPDSGECPQSYKLETSALTGEVHSLFVEENLSFRTVHRFEAPATMDRIRIECFSTKGAASVSILQMHLRRV